MVYKGKEYRYMDRGMVYKGKVYKGHGAQR